MTTIRPQKSTIVRTHNTAFRLAFGVGEWLAPRAAGRAATRLWFTVPPGPAPAPLPEGGTPFTVTAAGADVHGLVWGEGPVVYLVHGWGGRGSQFASYVGPLVAQGFRVVVFDGPSHGDSGPGRHGPHQTHGVELGQALDAAFARFGPAHAVVAHSLGTISTYLALRYGWISTRRLVFLAPMVEAASLFDAFQRTLGFGRRTRRAFDRAVDEYVGIPVTEFDARLQAAHVDPVPTLVVHDRGDRQTSFDGAVSLVATLPDARLVTTDGLGHRRILRDSGVLGQVLGFLQEDGRPVSVVA